MSYDFKLNNGDIPILSSGEPSLVRDEDKLLQDVLKMLFTPSGENTIHPWYGTNLLSKSVGLSFDSEILATEVQTAVEFGLKNLITLQELQESDLQYTSPRERISRIEEISVQSDPVDARKIVVNISLVAKSGDIVTESIIVNV